ncbi:T7SS effector LXG polymorphic toxin [Roseburia sp. MSJ-14]|uniref:T7SS effector LXG polymorphic toxin n=1 Tax=Roseburia sp. MSJ-14 TaxID=2841514 RepID=UPI001C1003C2|nr:T7SS effector LXG polymorphic toxin [Roseburia sp. MSJ-14]MBU5472355.1 LXG domain-containing protein [Roseburia sp. MSJ-14]
MSGFVIKYIDIYNLLWEYKEKLETLIEDIGYCENSINDFITGTAFQGEAANSIKNYMNEVHITLLSGFKVTAQNILDNLILYKAGYYAIDSSTNFVLPEEEIKAFRNKLNGNALDTEEYADKVNRKLGEVSDIYQVSHPDTNGVFKIHQQIDQELLNFITDIETQESTTVAALEQSAELLISGLKNCVSKIASIDITNYESNSFYQDAEVYALASLSQNCYQNHENYKGIYDEIWNNEQALRDAADARETQGIWKTVGGVFLVVGGTVCIVASGGAATPIVAAGWTAGGGTIAFGVADSIEGAQDIYYGSIGDIDSTSINYLKSVVFQGNEDAYYLTENVFAFASSAFIPISQAARVGNLTFRSGVTTVAKEGIAMMAGAGASDVTMRVTGSQTASVVAGMLTSWGTGHGLNGVDTRFNISGNRVKNGSVSRADGTGYKELTGYEYLDAQLGSLKGKVKINQYQSAESVNDWWANNGYDRPPYTPKTVVQDITLDSDTIFVRVYDGDISGLRGGWVMRAEDIKGLTPEQIQQKFALPSTPKYIGEVKLKAGSNIRMGEVNPNYGCNGGGIQFDLKGQYIGEFKEIGSLVDWSMGK